MPLGHTEVGALLPQLQYRVNTVAQLTVPLFVSRARAAQMLAVSVQTIDKLGKQGNHLPSHVGRSVADQTVIAGSVLGGGLNQMTKTFAGQQRTGTSLFHGIAMAQDNLT
jgi:hypothetical protein